LLVNACTTSSSAATIESVAETDLLRTLPSVHEVLERLSPALAGYPHALLVSEIRRVLDAVRRDLRAGLPNGLPIEARVEQALAALNRPSLRRVINATGVVLHTNLGRAPLGPLSILPGYSNLEYDLAAGCRGKRDDHVAGLLERLLGASAIAVNNNAAALYLALHELAAGGEVVISRGELIEIGDGFRIPEIMARSGAAIREVGTTNRTRVEDYSDAIGPNTRLLLRVHPSNFRIQGFTARPELRDLVALGRDRGIPVYEDLGSGCLVDLRDSGVNEPLVTESLEAGADLVSFSGDKLLGGPQAGILAGKTEIVARLRRNPMFRALRLDKMVYQALENSLRSLLFERWDEVPALAMIRQSAATIRGRAAAFLERAGVHGQLADGSSVIGGGATPEQSVPTCLIVLDWPNVADIERRLRAGQPPVVARVEDQKLVLDLRTVLPAEEDELAAALRTVTPGA